MNVFFISGSYLEGEKCSSRLIALLHCSIYDLSPSSFTGHNNVIDIKARAGFKTVIQWIEM